MFCEYVHLDDRMDEEAKALQVKILERSGYSEETHVPPSLKELPVMCRYSSAREEASMVIFSAVEDLLKRASTSPRAIDILIINNSLFTPVPSLTAMVINRFNMRSNVMSFNLSGMGCSAGIVSVSLASDLLKVHRNSLALVVSTEVLTGNWYTGKNKSMLISNCTCVYQDEDSENKMGILLSKTLVTVAGDALKTNMASLGRQAQISGEHLSISAYMPEAKL